MNFNFLRFALDGDTVTADPTFFTQNPWIIYVGYGVLAIGLVVVFVLMNRKSKKQEQEVADMRNSLRIGDEVTTTGGIVGRVVQIKEETVVLETSRDGTKIRFLKSAIARVDVPIAPAQKDDKNEKK